LNYSVLGSDEDFISVKFVKVDVNFDSAVAKGSKSRKKLNIL
jgi:hypothetical protein